MPKGILYNLNFKKNNGQVLIINNISMNDLINNIITLIKQEYNIDQQFYKINNKIIYNLQNGRYTNKILKNCIKVVKC
jgi:hypothetical protein